MCCWSRFVCRRPAAAAFGTGVVILIGATAGVTTAARKGAVTVDRIAERAGAAGLVLVGEEQRGIGRPVDDFLGIRLDGGDGHIKTRMQDR